MSVLEHLPTWFIRGVASIRYLRAFGSNWSNDPPFTEDMGTACFIDIKSIGERKGWACLPLSSLITRACEACNLETRDGEK